MNVLVLGAGICGLGTALLLARDGREVTVIERDPDPLPDSPQAAWEMWTRKGVAQFRQPHNFMPGLREILERDLPDVQKALPRAGASRYDLSRPLPPTLPDQSPRPIDERLWTWTARRPVGEWVFATAALREPRLTMRRGEQVTSLVTGAPMTDGIPHVTRVRTAAGEEIRADLVVDATGRQSPASRWLSAISARPVYEEQADSGFTYYTRYFRGAQLPVRKAGGLTPLGSMSLLTLPGDNDTWSVTIFTATGDQPLKQLRHDDKWTNVVRGCPLHAHWLDGEPITSVLPMSGIVDRYRCFVVDGVPVVTGFVAVADALACTNPSAGRGLTVGFKHAVALRDVLRSHPDDPAALVNAFNDATEATVWPWYRAQIAVDRMRFAEMEALREGRQPPQVTDELARAIRSLFMTIGADADLFRAAMEYVGTLTPAQEILERPEVAQRIRAVLEGMKGKPPLTMPGPNRQQLLDLLA
jgi:2-polyprenyl-6-methoxyphenol hydroxylase-like FAD-dependent oxidoreductase